MAEKTDRIQDLVNEIKTLREVNTNLHRQINNLESKAYTKDLEIKALLKEQERLRAKVSFLEGEKAAIQKRMACKIKSLENDVRKNGMFNQKVMATSKTKKEHLMIQEMDSLRKVNKTLLGFVEVLSNRFSFDGDLLKSLCDVAEGVDDRILRLFLDSFSQNNEVKCENEPKLQEV